MNGAVTSPDDCKACHNLGKFGYCARLRCYCGHPECHAADSYYTLEPLSNIIVSAPDERMAKSWKEREGPTWLDK